jgi:hypothetical protein
MDINEIEDAYWNGDYSYKMQIPERLNPLYIFDENLSVKQNREMVLEHNKRVEDMYREKMIKSNELACKLTNDVVAYIMNTYDMNENQSRLVERYVYNREHAFMSGYFSAIDEVAEMVESVLKA